MNEQETEYEKDYSETHPLAKEILVSMNQDTPPGNIALKFRDRVIKETGNPEEEPLPFSALTENGSVKIIGQEENTGYLTISIPLKETLPYINIRPIDAVHAIKLGFSIKENRQMAPCIGHLNENGQVVILAGDHRRRGLILATNWNYDLKVDLYPGTLSPPEIQEIQLTENKHKSMKPEERAVAYYKLFRMFLANNPKLTKKEVALRLNESPRVFYDAIRYEESLHPQIQKDVDNGDTNYSTALLFTRISDPERQLKSYIHAKNAKLKVEQIRQMVANIVDQEENDLGLWASRVFEEMSRDGAETNFKLTFNREAAEAIGYLYYTAQTLNNENLKDYVPMTEAVKRDMSKLILSTMQFLKFLRRDFPRNYKILKHLIVKRINEDGSFSNSQQTFSAMLTQLDKLMAPKTMSDAGF